MVNTACAVLRSIIGSTVSGPILFWVQLVRMLLQHSRDSVSAVLAVGAAGIGLCSCMSTPPCVNIQTVLDIYFCYFTDGRSLFENTWSVSMEDMCSLLYVGSGMASYHLPNSFV
jgi:hypothetical protein